MRVGRIVTAPVLVQLSLGDLVKALDEIRYTMHALKVDPAEVKVRYAFGNFHPFMRTDNTTTKGIFHNWPGDHSELALDITNSSTRPVPSVADVHVAAQQSIGETFMRGDGYFKMDENTPLWVSERGECAFSAVVGVFWEPYEKECVIHTWDIRQLWFMCPGNPMRHVY